MMFFLAVEEGHHTEAEAVLEICKRRHFTGRRRRLSCKYFFQCLSMALEVRGPLETVSEFCNWPYYQIKYIRTAWRNDTTIHKTYSNMQSLHSFSYISDIWERRRMGQLLAVLRTGADTPRADDLPGIFLGLSFEVSNLYKCVDTWLDQIYK